MSRRAKKKNEEQKKKKKDVTRREKDDDADGGGEKKIHPHSKNARVLSDANRVPAPNQLSRQNCLSLRPCSHSFCLLLCICVLARARAFFKKV